MEKETPKSLQEVVYEFPAKVFVAPKAPKPATQNGSGFLYLSAVIANLIAFTAGIAFAWTSPVIPKLNGSVDPELNPLGRSVTPSEESWIAALLPLGAALGPLAAGATADKIGRKKTLLVLALPMMMSLLMSATATTVPIFYLARLLVGFGAGSVFAVLPNYLGEIAEDHNRGTLGCLMGVFVSSGLLFSYVVGPFLTIRNFCLVCLIPLSIFLPVFSVFIPETPQFLRTIQDAKGLEVSLRKLRSKSIGEVRKEMEVVMKNALDDNGAEGGIAELLKSKGLRKGLIVSLGLISLQQLAGINAVLAYMQSIFNATGSGMSPETSTIIVGGVQVCTTIVTSSIVDRLGRRILLLISATGSCLSLITLGLYFYLKTNGYSVDAISWLPVLSLLVFIISFNIGLGPLPWAVMAELFPSNVKSAASTATSVVCFVVAFLITLYFPALAVVLGMAESFWLFSLFCLVGVMFIYWVVPETKGRTAQEIQYLLAGTGGKV